jgi:hypothetical protein
MLKAKAKTEYMREYMRRKRAGLPTRKEPKERRPSAGMISRIEYWARLRQSRPWRLYGTGRKVIDGLALDTDDSWMEACRRYKAILDERRERKKAARHLICEKCVTDAAGIIASKRM